MIRSKTATSLMAMAAMVSLSSCQTPDTTAASMSPRVSGSETAALSHPNIVIILADDMGWRDVGYNGSEIKTPNIDGLAAKGVILDRYYAQPTCSPTRSALMTGHSPMRLGVVQPLSKLAPTGLPLSEKLLPQYLKEANYQTVLTGKWHLGGRQRAYLPTERGFDQFYGSVNGGIGYWDHVHGGGLDWQRNGKTLREEGYSTDLITTEAIKLVRGRDKSRPLMLYAAFGAPHLPNEAPEAAIAQYADIKNPHRRVHAAMVTELDLAIGRLVETLKSEGMLDNTIIWFMSDNGGLIASPPPSFSVLGQQIAKMEAAAGTKLTPRFMEFLRVNNIEGGSDNLPLKGAKATVYEGAARVPSFVYWQGKLSAKTSAQMITAQDVLPTLLQGAGLKVPARLDGRSLWPALAKANAKALRVSDYVIQASKGLGQDEAYYRYPWKLVRIDGAPEALYNVEQDPSEKTDLAELHPNLVKKLSAALTAFPRGASVQVSMKDAILDPDFFGGKEDRAPWADTVLGPPPSED
jgi:arylsulfatase A-like enzyme